MQAERYYVLDDCDAKDWIGCHTEKRGPILTAGDGTVKPCSRVASSFRMIPRGRNDQMSEDFPPIPSVQEMIEAMERSWNALQAVLDGASGDDLVRKTDDVGWSARDHLAHLDAWADSVLVMLRDGQPQGEVLGIDPARLEEEADYDRQNQMLRQQTIDRPLDEVRASLASTHEEFMRVLRGMTDEDLNRASNAYVPGSGEFEIAHKIMGNTYMHYDDHREYIERILAS